MMYRIPVLTYIKLFFVPLVLQMHLLGKLQLLVLIERTGGAAVSISIHVADHTNRICYDLRYPITMDQLLVKNLIRRELLEFVILAVSFQPNQLLSDTNLNQSVN